MRWSLKIARVGGTIVQIHVTFFLLLAWIAGAYYLQGGMQAAVDGTIFILLIFACVLLHEFGHALAARRYGIPTPTITLLPIGGVARLQRMPEKPGEELVVAAAGPLVNVAIAGLLYIFVGSAADVSVLAHIEEQQFAMLNKLLSVNIFLVVFNLIPAFPMDGGRMLRALLAFRIPYARATRLAATVGQSLAFVFGFFGLFGNPLLLLIALFVYIGASQEAALVEMRESTRGLTVADALIPGGTTFTGEESIQEAARGLLQSGQAAGVLTDDDGRPRGVVFRRDAFRALQQGNGDDRVETIAGEAVPTVTTFDVLNDALTQMQSEGHSALPAVDEEGRFAGILSLDSVGEMLMLRTPEETSTHRPSGSRA